MRDERAGDDDDYDDGYTIEQRAVLNAMFEDAIADGALVVEDRIS